MILITFFLLSELSRTTGFIDIPTVPDYAAAGTFSIGFIYSLPLFNEDPDPTDNLEVDPNDFDAVLKYSFGRGEIALSMFTANTFVANVKYLLVKGGKSSPSFFVGIDDISYAQYISTVGRGANVGFIEEKNYYLENGGRPQELLSGYFAIQQSIAPFFNFVLGLGRGRFVGYGNRSHIFNTDLIVIGDEYALREHSPWVFGLFAGGSIKFPMGLEIIAEMDGRDANAGVKYHHKYFSATFALTKIEHFFNSGRPYSPRSLFGLELNNRFMTEKPKTTTIECLVMDIATKELLQNSVIELKEINKKYTAVDGTLILTLAAGNYTMIVTKPDYVDYTAKLSLKSGAKSKLVFNLRKTEEAMKLEIAAREREQAIKTYLEQGKIYFLENKLDPAKAAFGMVISLDPGNTAAKEYLAQIEPKRLELIATYTEEAKTRTGAGDLAKAIEAWQKVLSLDPNNNEAKSAITGLQNKIVALKKPTEPAKPKITAAEIEALYKKGISLFTADKYDEALRIFKQVLAYDPKHTGAKDYKNRTEARIKFLGGG